jgi:hypothetical protein
MSPLDYRASRGILQAAKSDKAHHPVHPANSAVFQRGRARIMAAEIMPGAGAEPFVCKIVFM